MYISPLIGEISYSLLHSSVAYVCDASVCRNLNYRMKGQFIHPLDLKSNSVLQAPEESTVDDPSLPHSHIPLTALRAVP